MKVGIVGFGLMGQQRAKAIDRLSDHALVAVTDPVVGRPEELRKKMGFDIEPGWRELVDRDDLDVAIVSVPHNLAPEIVVAALESGKHVMCEKPLGRNTEESRSMVDAALKSGRVLEPGFNYRFYPGVMKMKELIDSGAIGQVKHVRCVIGHGGRPGYEEEWKLSKELCGGGALFDPGIHVVDLFRCLFGEIVSSEAKMWNAFWDIDVEDNALATFTTDTEVIVSMHATITEWKNRLSFDVTGTDGYLTLRGRSNNYGAQRLTFGKRWFWLSEPPQGEQRWDFDPDDNSFYEETKAFLEFAGGRPSSLLASAEDGLRAVEIIDGLYQGQGIADATG